MTEQPHYKLDVDKIKTIEDVKNVFELLDLGFYLPEDHKNYKLFKELTIQPEEPRKSLEEIKQELDEKFEELLVKIKRKSDVSKQIAESNYENKFDMISFNFEYAVKNGHFPAQRLFGIAYSNLSVNNAITVTSNFVAKPNAFGVGYWEIDPNIQVYRKTKPNRIVRYFSRLLLDFHWKDK